MEQPLVNKSAAGNVTFDPEKFNETILKYGWIRKVSRYTHMWNDRYFVLTPKFL